MHGLRYRREYEMHEFPDENDVHGIEEGKARPIESSFGVYLSAAVLREDVCLAGVGVEVP